MSKGELEPEEKVAEIVRRWNEFKDEIIPKLFEKTASTEAEKATLIQEYQDHLEFQAKIMTDFYALINDGTIPRSRQQAWEKKFFELGKEIYRVREEKTGEPPPPPTIIHSGPVFGS